MNLDNLVPIFAAFFVVTVSPGPANIALATVAMSSGRRNGLAFGLGLTAGLAFWGIIAATGLGVILQASQYALLILKVSGGCYLLWLACQSAISASTPMDNTTNSKKEGRWFYRGLLLNLSNPKAVVAWIAALSMGLGSGDSTMHIAVATYFCMVLGLANYIGYALAFSYSSVMSGYQRIRRWIDGIVAGLFALAGFSLIRAAFSR